MCDAACEDRDHQLTCPDPAATNVFNKGIKDLEKIMIENDTHLKLKETIINALKSTQANRVPAINRCNNVVFDVGLSLAGILDSQKLMGWKNFMLGRWSPKWREAQRRHYIRIGSKKSAKQWTIAILHKLQLIRNNLWQFRNKILYSLAQQLLPVTTP